MKVFLTGGTGLVGSHVAERLVAEGHGVRALVRPGAPADHLRYLDVELREGDITRPASLAGALEGCDALVHAAAIVTPRVPYEVYRRVNVAGTYNVLTAASAQGVSRAVHVSSVAVYGGAELTRSGEVDETASIDRPLPPGELYGRSKREAEEAVWHVHRDGGLEVTVVRPDVIYGERDRVVIPLLARYLRSPLVLTVGRGDRDLPLVYAGNVAQAIVLGLTRGVASGRVYNLTTDFPITQLAFFRLLAAGLGRRPIFLPLPYPAADLVARALERIARLGTGRPLVARRHIAFMGRGNPFVSRRARAELGWRPEFVHATGVRRSVGWYLQHTAASES